MIQTADKNIRRSPYVAASKTKGTSFFPKIQKSECPQAPKLVGKHLGKRNYHESIFKIKGDIPARIKLPAHLPDLDEEKVVQSHHYRELQNEIQEMQGRFRQQMALVDSKKQAINDKLLSGKEDSYRLKYSLWEIKNQIMQLETALKEEQEQQERLLYELGYQQQGGTPDASELALEGDFSDDPGQDD